MDAGLVWCAVDDGYIVFWREDEGVQVVWSLVWSCYAVPRVVYKACWWWSLATQQSTWGGLVEVAVVGEVVAA